MVEEGTEFVGRITVLETPQPSTAIPDMTPVERKTRGPSAYVLVQEAVLADLTAAQGSTKTALRKAAVGLPPGKYRILCLHEEVEVRLPEPKPVVILRRGKR